MLSRSRRGLEPSLRSEPPLRSRWERESSLEGGLPSSDRNARFLRVGDFDGHRGRGRLPVEIGELVSCIQPQMYTASNQTSGTVVGERVLLEERGVVVVGTMNQEARAECQIKPNDKLQGVFRSVRLKAATVPCGTRLKKYYSSA